MIQSLAIPSFIKIIGNWFPKKQRAFIVSVWSTCVGMGNILGLQIAKWVLDKTDNNWPILFLVLTALDASIGILLFLII